MSGLSSWIANLSLMFSASKWQAVFENYPLILKGVGTTLLASVLGLLLALALGVVFGVLSSSRNIVGRAVARVYVEFFQNTPIMLQVVFLGFGVPIVWTQFGLLPALVVGVTGVGIYHGAYISEAVRAGIQSISRGQLEAAQSQGMSYVQAMRYVIIPQALTVVLPPLTNQAVNLIKNTSVLMYIGVNELMYVSKSIQADNYNPGPMYVVAMALYFLMCFPLATFAKRLEKKSEEAR